eukprot:COSAG01_NODE_19770_length_990_cov_1.169473_1_plen_49_part_10
MLDAQAAAAAAAGCVLQMLSAFWPIYSPSTHFCRKYVLSTVQYGSTVLF